jgi:sugar phosphate isomerase/epimerase
VREIAREAERLGLRLALEPFQREGIESWSILNTLGDAAQFVAEVGSDAVGIQFDVWHLWNTAEVLDEIPLYAHLIAGVHVNDWREPTRGWADRVLPGNGAADLSALLGVLDDVGWEGFYDLEIFSDNGAFGSAYPDSLWDLDAADLARRGRDAFFHTWSKRRVPAEAAGRRGET